MPKRPWRVLHTSGNATAGKYRSKSFTSEADALRWAKEFVRDAGPDADAHIYDKVMDEDREVDPVPAQYRVRAIGGSVSTMTWPEMARAQYEEWNRQMISGALDTSSHAGPRWVPEHFAHVRGPLPGPRVLE